MANTGYMTLFGVDCVFFEDAKGLLVMPKDEDQIRMLTKHITDTDVFVRYAYGADKYCTALIEQIRFEQSYTIRLVPKYTIKAMTDKPFSYFEIKGDAIDDFFRPSRYFYTKAKSGDREPIDLVYGNIVADCWNITFEQKPVTVTLSYGDILRHGIASDLMLHPQLKVEFPKSDDPEWLYRLYLVIIRFLQFVRYDINCGTMDIRLHGGNGKSWFNSGRIIDRHAVSPKHHSFIDKADYCAFKPFIQRILQFAADNPNLYMHHYPENGNRFFAQDYTLLAFSSLFGAFESECHASKDIYECADDTKITSIRTQILELIDEISIDKKNTDEKQFKENARNRISQLGTQFGQKKKIAHAYEVLSHALNSSIEYIFFRPEMCLQGALTSGQINKIAGEIAALRGTVVHGDFTGEFSDVQGQMLRFFEVLIYAQMLKRAQIEDDGIELIIGAIFHCNYVLVNKLYHSK